MIEKFVLKFNSLVSLLLEDLVNCLPDNANVNQVSVFFNSLIAVDPGNTELIEKFMRVLQGCSDFLITHNTDLFASAKEFSSSIDKNDVIEIYRALKEPDREMFWKYLNKMYSLGKKASPEMVKTIEFDYNQLTPKSPIFGLMDKKQPETQLVTAKPNKKDNKEGSMVNDAFLSTAETFINALKDLSKEQELQAIVASCELSLTGIRTSTTPELLDIFKATYNSDEISELVTDTEYALKQHGYPFIGSIDIKPNDAVIQSALKLGTLYITLTQMSGEIIGDMESIASKFTQKIQNGEIDIDLNNLDPMSIIAQLSNTDIGADLMKIINKI